MVILVFDPHVKVIIPRVGPLGWVPPSATPWEGPVAEALGSLISWSLS